jgi:hypothetical protein
MDMVSAVTMPLMQRPPRSFMRRLLNALGSRIKRLIKRLGLTSLFHPLRTFRIRKTQALAQTYFENTSDLRAIAKLVEGSESTGAGLTDYHLLHQYVLARRPRRILEFGSGRTSLIIAHALYMAHRDSGGTASGHLYSMEDVPGFHEDAKRLLPDTLRPYVTFLLSPKREFSWRNEIWGFGYSELPVGPFDLVFVDGPTEYRNKEDIRLGRKGVCLDLLCLLERDPDTLMDVIIDGKFNSAEAFQSVLPRRTVSYDPVLNVGVIAAVRGRWLQPKLLFQRIPTRNAWSVLGLT